MRHLDTATLALLTNRAVLAVNPASTDNQPHFVEDGTRIWSEKPESAPGHRYLAWFNTSDKPKRVGIALRDLVLANRVNALDLWTGTALGPVAGHMSQSLPPHGAGLYRLWA